MKRNTLRSRSVVVMAAALFVGSVAVAPSAGAQTKVLGPKQPAKGTPVKIGLITDGKTSGSDNTIETPVAQATVEWINQYRNGVGGHPIDLDICVANAEASKAVDCANQMIRDKAAAVVFGANAQAQASWEPLHAAGIPTFAFALGNQSALQDPSNTFVFGSGTNIYTILDIGAAKSMKPKAKKLTAVVIDVPAATDFWKTLAPGIFKEAGLDLELVTVPLGTADMTAQMAKVVANNPDGVVQVVGNDSFCIAAFNGLRTAGFKGQVTAITQCLSDATRTAVPADFLEGIKIFSTGPLENPKDPSIKQYYAVLDKFGAADVDKTRTTGMSMFQGMSGLNVATQNLKGEATPASIIAAAKAMPWSVVPGTGGLHAQCGANIQPANPAVCMPGGLLATLGADGKVIKYTPANDVKPTS